MEKITTTNLKPNVYGYVVVRWEDGKPTILNKVYDTEKKAENFIKKTEDNATYTVEGMNGRMSGFLSSIVKDRDFTNYFVSHGEDGDLYIQLGDLRITDGGSYFTDAPDPYLLEDYAFFVRAETVIMEKVRELYEDSETGTRC